MNDSEMGSVARMPSHALLAAIVESSFDAIISKTLQGTITSWNIGAERIFGFSSSEAIGRPITMLVPSDRLNEEGWILARLRAGERIENFETVRVRKDGQHIDVSLTSSPVRDLSGEIVGASKIVRDVSAARLAARELAESQARLAAIVESAMDAIITVNARGRVVVFNDAAVSMFRCPADEAIGGMLDRFLPPRHRPQHADWMQAFGAGTIRNRAMGRTRQVYACRADGSEFPVEASISHVSVHGEQLYAVILRDLSDLRAAQADRRALEAQLREAQKMESIGTLAGGIAHEVNNALGAILGNVALAQEDLLAGHPASASIHQIHVAAQRARAVVRQILSFSRHQAQELVVQPVRPIISEAVALVRSMLPSIVRLEADLPAEEILLRADANQVHQVLLNLCTNAWHALQGSTGVIKVGLERVQVDAAPAGRLAALEPGPYVRLWVADNGCGMDAATRARVFDPFFTTKARGEGTGLGLSVVHGIVMAHGGMIVLDSEPGVGTLFSIYLPEPAAGLAHHEDRVVEAAVHGGGRRVAYVDDDEVMLLMVERLLARRGFEVHCYGEPGELLERLGAAPLAVDVVLSDFNMPGMTGIDLARRLAAMNVQVPVIVSSGHISSEMGESARQAGVAAVLEKEDMPERLAPLVARLLASGSAGTERAVLD